MIEVIGAKGNIKNIDEFLGQVQSFSQKNVKYQCECR